MSNLKRILELNQSKNREKPSPDQPEQQTAKVLTPSEPNGAPAKPKGPAFTPKKFRTPKHRLPDKSEFHVTYDGLAECWSGRMNTFDGDGVPLLFVGKSKGVFGLLSKLDQMWQKARDVDEAQKKDKEAKKAREAAKEEALKSGPLGFDAAPV